MHSPDPITDPPPHEGPMVSGRTLVLAAVGIGVAMAVAAWWFRYEQSRRAARFWGPRMGQLIIDAERVELLELEDTSEATSDDAEPVAGRRVVARHDLTKAPGLVYLGYALSLDANFDWEAPAGDADAIEWDRAFEFERGGETGFVLLADDLGHIAKLEIASGEPVPLACPKMAEPLAAFLSTAVEGHAADASRAESASETPPTGE